MVVGGVFRDISRELDDFDFALEFTLECSEENFSLTGFESIDHTGNGARVVIARELNEFLVDEVVVSHVGLGYE